MRPPAVSARGLWAQPAVLLLPNCSRLQSPTSYRPLLHPAPAPASADSSAAAKAASQAIGQGYLQAKVVALAAAKAFTLPSVNVENCAKAWTLVGGVWGGQGRAGRHAAALLWAARLHPLTVP